MLVGVNGGQQVFDWGEREKERRSRAFSRGERSAKTRASQAALPVAPGAGMGAVHGRESSGGGEHARGARGRGDDERGGDTCRLQR